MKIAVISMIRDNWGGSEELWYDMAKKALSNGHSVMHLSYETDTIHPKMQELINLGLQHFTRPGFRKSGNNFFKNFTRLGINFLKKRLDNSIKKIFDQSPDVVLYNGTCYSISDETTLHKYIR